MDRLKIDEGQATAMDALPVDGADIRDVVALGGVLAEVDLDLDTGVSNLINIP
jgi:hypothetical protein